jgi:hypothetical protein
MSDVLVRLKESGILRPIQPLDLEKHKLAIAGVSTTSPARSTLAVKYSERIKRQLEAEDPAPGLAEVTPTG